MKMKINEATEILKKNGFLVEAEEDSKEFDLHDVYDGEDTEYVEELLNKFCDTLAIDINDITSVSIVNDHYDIELGNEEWVVYPDYSDAEKAAVESCKDILDDMGVEGINFDMLGGIEQFVDTSWFEDAYREMAEYHLEDLDEDEREEEYGHKDLDSAVDEYMDRINDYVEEYISDFGKEEFNEVVKKHNLIDFDELAKAIVDVDGVGNSLATYDGEETELEDNYGYAYRIN